MEDQVIVTTPAQLQSMIGEAVGAIIPKLAEFRRKNEAVETDGMTVEQATSSLFEQESKRLGEVFFSMSTSVSAILSGDC